jgi:hypothetical protein
MSITFLSLALSQAAPAQPIASRVTAKATDTFAQCFVAAQDRTSGAWSFVPKESGGGTFSNLGARGVRHPYFLDVADRGAVREIRLSAAGGNRSVMRAVDRCI